ncbi:MAG TPA: DUF937 domain-containing protein [Blastocatellia bacterium]|nr:DUF937 domain-containing protein [Blastocatellia bacterium]HMV84130.1 DUF937 domain-containing protein [Blastocatellia bacterium]HMX29739.1 DUF937 domain-containing protein [Blastocatellia bacterium]HMY75281.1 DUF937 domain-containing protein [Blastocatellia bacterium]HMZ17949.1 DUF937 domain-containing protein [Blastocatellia bacterium]
MNLTGILNDALSGDTVGQISQAIGADEGTTSSAIQSALPMLLGGLANNSSTEGGASGLLGAIDRDHDGSVLDDIGGLIAGNLGGNASNGAGILGHIFGGSQGGVEQAVSQSSGLDMSKVGPLLAILAPIVMGAIGRSRQQGEVGTSDLGGLLGGAAQQMGGGGDLMGMLGGLLDRNHDGSAVDDVVGMLGGLLGGRR